MRLTRLRFAPLRIKLAKLLRFTVLAILICLLVNAARAQAPTGTGVRGKITSTDGEVMAFATIYVKQTESGTTANESGLYEINLTPGFYNLTFRFLGHETVLRSLEITDGYLELNIVLKPQATLLQEMVVGVQNEDPAYTIMRKAIAKASYHRQQVDFYS